MKDFNFSNNPIKDWLSDQEWNFYDPTVKGFFSQLLLFSSQTRPYGHITSDERKLRKILGIPYNNIDDHDFFNIEIKENDVSKTIKRYFEENKKTGITASMMCSLSHSMNEEEFSTDHHPKIMQNYDFWTVYLWENKWKPELLKNISVIDDDMVSDMPELSSKIGDYFIPLGYHLGSFFSNNKISSKNSNEIKEKPKKRTRKVQSIPLIDAESLYCNIDDDNVFLIDSLNLFDFNVQDKLSFRSVFKALKMPLSEKEKETIWDLGISIVSVSKDKKDIERARGIIAKAMKNYGKEATIAAITKMSLVKDKQLNPHAYLIKLLELSKKETEDNNNIEKFKISQDAGYVIL